MKLIENIFGPLAPVEKAQLMQNLLIVIIVASSILLVMVFTMFTLKVRDEKLEKDKLRKQQIEINERLLRNMKLERKQDYEKIR